jgi:Polyketide cyclase / dehydrase and lipid transport
MKELKEYNGIKLKVVSTSININASSEKTWDVLSHYGDVSTFHAGVEKSVNHIGYTNIAALGVERTCDVLDGKREVVLKEKITEYKQGEYYRYQVYEWKNFPLKAMFFAFSVEEVSQSKSKLMLTINYRLKPSFITNMMKWKIKKMEKDILIGYKNYIETGNKKVPIKTLKKLNYQFT